MGPSATQLITTNGRSETGVVQRENARAMKLEVLATKPPGIGMKSGRPRVVLGMGSKHPIFPESCTQF